MRLCVQYGAHSIRHWSVVRVKNGTPLKAGLSIDQQTIRGVVSSSSYLRLSGTLSMNLTVTILYRLNSRYLIRIFKNIEPEHLSHPVVTYRHR